MTSPFFSSLQREIPSCVRGGGVRRASNYNTKSLRPVSSERAYNSHNSKRGEDKSKNRLVTGLAGCAPTMEKFSFVFAPRSWQARRGHVPCVERIIVPPEACLIRMVVRVCLADYGWFLFLFLLFVSSRQHVSTIDLPYAFGHKRMFGTKNFACSLFCSF